MYKTFEVNGMKNSKEMIEFHVGSIRKGTPTIEHIISFISLENTLMIK